MRSRNLVLSTVAPFACALALAVMSPAAAHAQEAQASASAAAPAVKDIALSAAERQRFVGTYTITMSRGGETRTMPFRIYEEKDALFGQPDGGRAARMLYQGENTFRPEHDTRMAVTFTLEGDRATRFKVNTPEGTIDGVRTPN
jgi:hypothetical protein